MPEHKKTCFVVMPISDQTGYESGHFGRVYKNLIKPACEDANFEVTRADDVKNTNYIVLDILNRIVSADIIVVDLSAKNPNVLYELGIRQAFDKPAVLIKDAKTDRIFDIQGIRTIDYDENLRIDLVEKQRKQISAAVADTVQKHPTEPGSLIRMLSVQKGAELPEPTTITGESRLIMDALGDVASRLSDLERSASSSILGNKNFSTFSTTLQPKSEENLPPGMFDTAEGTTIYDGNSNELGTVIRVSRKSGTVFYEDLEGNRQYIQRGDPLWEVVTPLPF